MEILELLKNKDKAGPSFFQLNFFVVGKEPTAQAKMHRCIQEIRERYNANKNIKLEIEELKDQIELHRISLDDKDIPHRKREIRNRQIKRKVEAIQTQIEGLESKMNSYEEEIKFIKTLFDKINEKTPLKPWDDYSVQLEYWNEKLTQDIHTRFIMGAPIDLETVKTIVSLPDHLPIKKQLLEHVEKKMLSTDK